MRQVRKLPEWIPDAVRLYLSHTSEGLSLRALARERGCHASTILRKVRRFENRRDDPLVDEALNRLDARMRAAPAGRPTCGGGPVPAAVQPPPRGPVGPRRASPDTAPAGAPIPCGQRPVSADVDQDKDRPAMTAVPPGGADPFADADMIAREARRILPCLARQGALLAIAPDMAKAVVLREDAAGRATRLAVLDRHVAEAFALTDWIACHRPGRVASYALSAAGRAELTRLMAAGQVAPDPDLSEAAAGAEEDTRKPRYSGTESPVAVLARRRDRDGAPFLSADLVAAASRLHEDFEIARTGFLGSDIGPEDFTARLDAALSDRTGGARPYRAQGAAPQAALRLAEALRELGPGLADMALRSCCYHEGLETAERRLGWSARSGKIVLRIALQRLRQHYQSQRREFDLIG
ncbi:MAG: helix-turn-helix domain-containing protein [Rhodobacteraceae bacterium]|nr:helix-turn-helix domain-containing protein [Paracoccaceae bacterium]